MADLLFSSSNLSDEQASLNRKIAYYYMHKVTIGSFQLGVSWFSGNNYTSRNEDLYFQNSSLDPKHNLNCERNTFINSKRLKINKLGSLLALNESSIYNQSNIVDYNSFDYDDLLICLKIKGGQQEKSSFFSIKKLFAWFGILLSCSQGVRAFIYRLFGVPTPNPQNYPTPGKPGQDLRKTNPCEYNARGRSYKGYELSAKRRESNYNVPSRESLTYEDYSTYGQCRKKYKLSPLEERMLPSERDNYIRLKGSTSIQGENLSDYQVRIGWGQSRKGKKDTKHGYIFGLHPKLDKKGQPVTRINCKDPSHQVSVPQSHTGQQSEWHEGQTQFCRKYNKFEIKTNINYMQHADGSFANGGFAKGLTIFDRERNIMCVARPDNPQEVNPTKFTIVTTFNPSPREIEFYESLGVLIPGDVDSYDQFEKKVKLLNSSSDANATSDSNVTEPSVNSGIDIVNPELLRNETKNETNL